MRGNEADDETIIRNQQQQASQPQPKYDSHQRVDDGRIYYNVDHITLEQMKQISNIPQYQVLQ